MFSRRHGLPVADFLAIARALHGRTRVTTFYAAADDNLSTQGYADFFARAPYGVKSIQASPRTPVTALRALREGEVLTMQPDVCGHWSVRSRITLRFEEPLMNAPTGNVEADAHRLTFAIYECLERHIRAFPEQWAY